VEASVVYVLADKGATLKVIFEATTDMPTVINMAQHSYFNLGGHDSGSILDHEVTINA
jgi:aldose 1-epimerase